MRRGPRAGDAAPTLPVSVEASRYAVDVAAGRRPASLLLRGARVLDPFGGTLRAAEVLLAGPLVAAVLPTGTAAGGDPSDRAGTGSAGGGDATLRADAVVELDGGVLTPGLIDGHVHIESSLVAPRPYAEAVLPRGVTGVVCDPHELANVAGVEGVRWLLERAEEVPFDLWFTVPSCVPSTSLETTGATLGEAETRELLAHPAAVGLAELMSFPQVVAADAEQLRKPLLAEAAGGTVEGHAPALAGRALQAYLAAGVHSDHEAGDPDEGREKIAAGLFVLVREGSAARDARALAPLVDARYGERVGFCSDDVLPHDLLRDGAVDHALRVAIAAGADPVVALRAATWNVARHYRLARRGAVAPGYVADLAWWRGDPAEVRCGAVWKAGREVARDGRIVGGVGGAGAPDADRPAGPTSGSDGAAAAGPDADRVARGGGASGGDAVLLRSVRLPQDLGARLDAALAAAGGAGGAVPVVVARASSLLTGAERVVPRREEGRLAADPERDLALLVCAERHGRNGNVAAAAVRGFGLRRGALATSVGHDHHNLMAVGAERASLLAALRRVEALGGGLVACDGDAVLAELPLPLGGLITDASLPEVRDALDRLDAAAAALGCTLPAPLMALSFLGLAVIPELKLTDRGLVDVRAGRLLQEDAPPRGRASA